MVQQGQIDHLLQETGEIPPPLHVSQQAALQDYDGVYRRFVQALQRALPQLDPTDVGVRMMFLVGSMAFTMAWGNSFASMNPDSTKDPEDVLESLIQYAAAGMASSVPVGVPVGAVQKGRAS